MALVKSPFAIIPWEVAADQRLTSRHLRVLIALLSFRSQDTGPFWATRAQIKERCGLRLTRISEVTTQLEGFGWLKKTGSGHTATRYMFSVPTVPDLGTVPEMGTVTESGTVTVPKVGTQQSPPSGTLLDPSETPSETLTPFERWWAIYPRGVGKKTARKAWDKNKLDSIVDRLIEDTVYRALNDDSWKQKQFIPHPTTYLNQERWNDEVQTYEAPRRNLSAVERVAAATRARETERTTDKRIVAEDGGDLRPQVGQLIRGNGHG